MLWKKKEDKDFYNEVFMTGLEKRKRSLFCLRISSKNYPKRTRWGIRAIKQHGSKNLPS